MEPRLANFVSLSAARIDLDFVRDKNTKEDTAPRPESLDGFILWRLLLLLLLLLFGFLVENCFL